MTQQLFNVKNRLQALLITAGSGQLQAQHDCAWVKGFGGNNVDNYGNAIAFLNL